MTEMGNKSMMMTKIQLTMMLILIVFVSVTGATYAYFTFSDINDGTINGDMATVNLTLTVNKIFPVANSDNTGVMVPQLSVSGSATSPLSNALKAGCVDSNKNIVCQVYKIVIKNDGGTATQVVDGSAFFYGNASLTTDVSRTMPNLRWKLVDSVNATTPANSVLGTNSDKVANAVGQDFISNSTMVTNAEFTYYMIIWINETGSDQTVDEGNSFYGKIVFDSSNGTGVTASFAT